MQEDDICRIAFADAGMTRRALELLPKRATAELDPRRLRRLPTEHVASGGQRRRADMAWAVGTLGSKAEALLALEFQSSPDRAMALRMEIYAALLRQEVAAEGGLRAGGLLPLVLYTGARRWRPQTLGGLTAPTPAGWQARFEFLLLDATALTAEDGRSNPAAALLRLLASRKAESLPAMAKTLFEQLRPAGSNAPAEQERRAFAKRLARALMRMLIARFAGDQASGRHRHQMQQALLYMEEPTMLAEAITEWRQNAIAEGRTEGVREGTSEGRRTLLRRLATRRHGPETGDEFGRLLAGEDDAGRLALAGDLVIDCSSAEELLSRGRRLLKGGNGEGR